jgi:hypothetical protein
MPGSKFKDKAVKPDSKTFADAIGETAGYWNRLHSSLEAQFGELVEDWKFYGQKSGWILKLLRKKRNLFFITPQDGFFRVSFVFGDKAVAEVENSDLPDWVKKALRDARKYAEGRGLQIEVKTADDVDIVKKLVRIKVQN